MKFRDLLYEMSNSLFSSKLRTALTMLGLVIGIVSVIVMLAAVQGVQNMVLGQMGGARASVVSFGFWEQNSEVVISKKEQRIYRDIEYLKNNVPHVKEIGINAYANLELTNGSRSVNSFLMALDRIAGDLSTLGTPSSGRPITSEEFEAGAPVVVLTHESAKQLFENPDEAVGKRVQVKGAALEVIGVLPQGGMLGGGSDVIPLKAVERRIPKAVATFGTLEVVFEEESQVTEGSEMLVRVFNAKYPHLKPDENIYTFAYSEMLNEVRQFTQVFSILALVIASTSLTVGGIGIMNMMLTNVTERTREIGLRKAIGAKGSSITWQFLAEAIAVCLAGNFVAVIISYIFVFATSQLIPIVVPTMEGFDPVITWWSLLISVGVSTFIALVFGWYPARRASKLDPIEALRYQ